MKMQTQERIIRCLSGWYVLPITLGLVVAAPFLLVMMIVAGDHGPNPWYMAATFLSVLFTILSAKGFFTLQPNNAAVLTLFGRYVGTER